MKQQDLLRSTSKTPRKSKKRTAAERTENKQRIAASKARAKRWAERKQARILLQNRPTTQPTQVAVAPQEPVASQQAIPVTATPVPTHIWNLAPRRVPQDPEDLIELFTRRSFFQENLEYIQQEISRIDREIERQIAPRFRSNR